MALDPERGYVASANHDIGHLTTDGSLANDAHYLGGPFAPGFRAETITTRLEQTNTEESADVAAMSAIQGDHHSPLGLRLVPALKSAIEAARTLADGGAALDADEARLAGFLTADRAGIEEAEARLDAWIARGATAASGVTTFYDAPTDDDRADAVATMIFNEWYRRLFVRVFGDEGVEDVWKPDPRFLRSVAITSLLEGRGPENPAGLASYSAATEESVFWDDAGTPAVETSEEMILGALADALEALRAPPDATDPALGGFGTTDMDAWLWGLRHQVELVSLLVSFAPDTPGIELLGASIDTNTLPLAEGLDAPDPRAELSHFPRPSDHFAVDAANPSYDPEASYRYRTGPVMRMVIRLGEDGIDGVNIIPGGQSADASSEHFADQAALWLGNETLPFRYELEDVVAGATGREVYVPR
jgi:acyl-homoserine lactone acylase PvdQ